MRDGIGIAMGVWVSGGISGGHINPAVSFFFTAPKYGPLMTALILRSPWPWQLGEISLGGKYQVRDSPGIEENEHERKI